MSQISLNFLASELLFNVQSSMHYRHPLVRARREEDTVNKLYVTKMAVRQTVKRYQELLTIIELDISTGLNTRSWRRDNSEVLPAAVSRRLEQRYLVIKFT
uniref:DUF4817 domain-containing protein n=1 Tax=Heterorhabditis bacteriophora TaxID=37862 RepID=A0A1I7XFB3_HETBA